MKLRYHAPPLYFLHVPKTAGVAFGTLLASAYGRKERIHLAPPALAHQTVEQVQQQYRLYHSWHQNRGMYDLLRRKELACITLLRDPVERAVSAIRYRQRCTTDSPQQFTPEVLARLLPLRHADLAECLDHRVFWWMVENYQTRQLGLKSDYSPFFGCGVGPGQEAPHEFGIPLPLLTEVADAKAVFANACAWLDEMTIVGVTERYTEMVILTCDLLGIAPPLQALQVNVNPQRSSVTMRYRQQLEPATIARLEELNRYDAKLHAYAYELFEQQWARYQARPRRTYSIAPRIRNVLRPAKSFARRVIGKAKAVRANLISTRP